MDLLIVLAGLLFVFTIIQRCQENNQLTIYNLRKMIQLLMVILLLLEQQHLSIKMTMDDIILVRSNDQIHHPFPPLKNRTIEELSEEGAYSWIRFTKQQLQKLLIHLRIPPFVISHD